MSDFAGCMDSETKKRLAALAKRSKRSKSFLAEEVIGAYLATEVWQRGEIHAGMADLDSGAQGAPNSAKAREKGVVVRL